MADSLPSAAITLELLDHGPREHVQRQVVWATGFGVGTAHAKAAEGLHTDESAGYCAVEVDVPGA